MEETVRSSYYSPPMSFNVCGVIKVLSSLFLQLQRIYLMLKMTTTYCSNDQLLPSLSISAVVMYVESVCTCGNIMDLCACAAPRVNFDLRHAVCLCCPEVSASFPGSYGR